VQHDDGLKEPVVSKLFCLFPLFSRKQRLLERFLYLSLCLFWRQWQDYFRIPSIKRFFWLPLLQARPLCRSAAAFGSPQEICLFFFPYALCHVVFIMRCSNLPDFLSGIMAPRIMPAENRHLQQNSFGFSYNRIAYIYQIKWD